MPATFHHGTPHMVDYTPGTAVTAGQIVVVGNNCWVAHSDIAANQLGAMAAPSGSASYKVTLAAGIVFTIGERVNIDGSGNATDGVGTHFGHAIQAADQGAGDTVVYAQHNSVAP